MNLHLLKKDSGDACIILQLISLRICPSTAGCSPPPMLPIAFCLMLSCCGWSPPLLCYLTIFCLVAPMISFLSLVATLCIIWSVCCPSFFTASLAKWLRRPPRERKVPGSNPACDGIFSGSSHTSDLKTGTPVATLPGAWRFRVSTGTGRPGVSVL